MPTVSISKRTDRLGRRHRDRASSTGKRISLQLRDWVWLSLLHEHGPLGTSFLLAASGHLGRSEKRAKERLADLFHEKKTPHGGAYIRRPLPQFQTLDSRCNQLVHDLAPAGELALKEAGLWRDAHVRGGGPWVHQFMASSITASIRLACDARRDINYIQGADILERAGTTLSYPITIRGDNDRYRRTIDLKPDGLFGLEYKTAEGARYRFFVVEADRATEPLSSAKLNRKSALRNLLQYREYIAGGAYKSHLGLKAPMLVLNVTTSKARMDAMIALARSECRADNTYMLYQYWEAFRTPFKPPEPNLGLLGGMWVRAGNSINIARG